MSVLIETTLGDIVIDCYIEEAPELSLNFIKLCKVKYYNFSLFHSVERNFIAKTGDPSCTGKGGSTIFNQIEPSKPKYMSSKAASSLKHNKKGTVSMVASTNKSSDMNQSTINQNLFVGSQFFLTLSDDLDYLDNKFPVFGQVVEGLDVIEKINEQLVDNSNRPYIDIRIKHTIILDDPFDDIPGLQVPDESPLPTPAQLATVRISNIEEITDENSLTAEELEKISKAREAKAQALTLEMIGDLPSADVLPPENTLFVCKLNPITTSADLELIFSRFGEINSCEIITDPKTNTSLGYAFIEFMDKSYCEEAYFKMDNVLIDDRRIKVDFSQSVSKLQQQWASSRTNKSSSIGGDSSLQEFSRYRYSNKNNSEYEMVFNSNDNSPARNSHKSSSPERPSSRNRQISPSRNSPDNDRYTSRSSYRAKRDNSASRSFSKPDSRAHKYENRGRDMDGNRRRDRSRDRYTRRSRSRERAIKRSNSKEKYSKRSRSRSRDPDADRYEKKGGSEYRHKNRDRSRDMYSKSGRSSDKYHRDSRNKGIDRDIEYDKERNRDRNRDRNRNNDRTTK
ncbi:Peptidyl-prolyl cis-trans isomerase-like 4 [Smittium culicis]|uniref:Peptidyl-prolyl cis-trans isomerase n=1 Tax=Smittium culicis TaxID=133412 RepID=A0A1R1X390_9FUNG|nr:Peptidyl-prolyl cis-trans isomerase-like 4 [Smittium culicis]